MNSLVKKRDIKKRLIEESKGSFSVVHRALRDAKRISGDDHLDVDDVIKRIKEQMEPEKKAS